MADVLVDPFDAFQVECIRHDENQEGQEDAGHDFPGAEAKEGSVEEEQSGTDQQNVEQGPP